MMEMKSPPTQSGTRRGGSGIALNETGRNLDTFADTFAMRKPRELMKFRNFSYWIYRKMAVRLL